MAVYQHFVPLMFFLLPLVETVLSSTTTPSTCMSVAVPLSVDIFKADGDSVKQPPSPPQKKLLQTAVPPLLKSPLMTCLCSETCFFESCFTIFLIIPLMPLIHHILVLAIPSIFHQHYELLSVTNRLKHQKSASVIVDSLHPLLLYSPLPP